MKTFLFLLAASVLPAAEVKLGGALKLTEPMTVAQLIAKPEAYVDKTVQVKGKVTEVCQMMGCWMALSDAGSTRSIRVSVEDGVIVFPKDAAGRTAIAEGKLVKATLTREQAIAQARHEAEEQGRKFSPKSVKGPAVVYSIEATGAVLLD